MRKAWTSCGRTCATSPAQQVIDNLLKQPAEHRLEPEPSAREIVFRGTFEEVNAHFYEREWSDGLPIVPPTLEKIEEFLSFTDRAPDESLGILLPESRAATIWAVAVNGVMAGCRPEYMPILVALIEAMADPTYGVEHSGNTPGSDTLIILNGPIIKDLKFNYTQGVLREGFMPNTSVGRFWRLALRNMAGFLPHKNDKATFGNTFRVVLAENEDALAKIGWPPNSVDMGFTAGDNTVTISRMTGGGVMPSVTGSTPEQMMPYLADGVAKQTGWEMVFTVGGLSIRHLAPGARAQPHSGGNHCPCRLEQGRRQALPVRACAHARMARRGFHREVAGLSDRLAGAAGQSRPPAEGIS